MASCSPKATTLPGSWWATIGNASARTARGAGASTTPTISASPTKGGGNSMAFGAPNSPDHIKFVRDVEERFRYYDGQREQIVRDTLEMWDLFLTQKREFRAKGEEWRSNMALPD